MKKVLILVAALVCIATPASAWVVVAEPYVPAADGSVGIPTSFVYKVDSGAETSVAAVNPTGYPSYFTAPTGGWPAGSAAFVLDVTALKGNHSLVVKAVNAEGESAYSSPFAFTVPVKPVAPTQIRLLR